jgi:CRP-like cAMP-binding protein
MDAFYSAVQNIMPVSEGGMALLQQICSVRCLSRNDFVLRENEVCRDIYFVKSGLLRIYYYKDDKEVSEWFATEHNFCFSIVSYFKQTPSALMVQCLENSEVVFISRSGLVDLQNRNLEIANFAFQMMANSLILSQERMASVQFETALQRYEQLLRLNPGIVHRVPLVHIASFLGVSAETLSRIRGQVH